MIVYVNVRHSGSAFTVYHLLSGLKVTELVSVRDPAQCDVGWTHVHENTYDTIRGIMARGFGAFTTYRNGVDESCSKRKESLWVLAREKILFYDLLCEFDILPLHLDIAGRRDEELAEINRRFKLSLSTDWKKVPSMAGEV